jgi:hypothetical protein
MTEIIEQGLMPKLDLPFLLEVKTQKNLKGAEPAQGN